MATRLTLALVLSTTLIGSSGCGSQTSPPRAAAPTTVPSPADSKAAYVARADAICQRMQDRLAQIGVPGTDPHPSDLADSIDKRAVVAADGLAALRALPMPAAEAIAFKAVYARFDVVLQDYAVASGAVRIGLRSNAMAASVKAGDDAKKANAAATASGLTACATLPDPSL
jgi:hypothetical protein